MASAPVSDAYPVVGEADSTGHHHGAHDEQTGTAECHVRPGVGQQIADHRRHHYGQAAHGGGARLGVVHGGAVGPDLLTDAVAQQPVQQHR
jgi:hypothetical protein